MMISVDGGKIMDESEADRPVRSAQLSLRQRLEFIEFCLFWTGRLNRSDLLNKFRISPPQASGDIAHYQALAPRNLLYDTTVKGYVRSPEFEPLLIGRSIDRYLQQIVGVEQGWLNRDDTWFDTLPPVDVVSLNRSATDPAILLRLLDAIRDELELEVDYASMTGSPTMARTIAPHAMGWAWGRWYVRAWSAERNDFRDYALARIARVGAAMPRSVDPALDLEWHHTIDLVLVPNPLLDEDRQRAQRLEHHMADGELRLPVRLSMAFYLMAEHKLDIEPGILPPPAQPLVLANLDEVQRTREVVRTLSKQALAKQQVNR
jgi:hypothetical protein